MADPHNVEIEVDGHVVEFSTYAYGAEYECDSWAVENLSIHSCVATLESRHAQDEEAARVDLWVELDKNKLFPWERNVLGISIREKPKDSHKGTPKVSYGAEFTLNTAMGTREHELKDIVLSALGGTGFSLSSLNPASHEVRLIEDDGWHEWTCVISSFPRDASFKTLFMLRDTLSQAAFLPRHMITTPYLALRMIQLGQAESLIGYEESEWLECKSVAYELKNIHESLWKHELAENVAQFANSEAGGLLVIGYRTSRKNGVDTIAKLTPVPSDSKRLQTYRDVLKQRVHPPLSRVLVDSFPSKDGVIVCIFIPPQRSENQPYLVTGSVIEGRYIKSGLTIVRRQGDSSIPVTAEEVHSTIVAGRAFLRGSSNGSPKQI